MFGRAKVRELVERVTWLEWQLRAAAREHWAMLRRLLEIEGRRRLPQGSEPEPERDVEGVDDACKRFLAERDAAELGDQADDDDREHAPGTRGRRPTTGGLAYCRPDNDNGRRRR